MAAKDALRLFDLTVRTALLVEGVKLGQQRELNAVVAEAEKEFRKVMQRVKYEKLGQLTKAELLNLLKAVRASQSKVYGAYVKHFIKQLEEFMKEKTKLDAIILGTNSYDPEEAEPLSPTKAFNHIERTQKEKRTWPIFGLLFLPASAPLLWSRIRNTPIPANGILPEKLIAGFATTAQVSIENEVRKAYANNMQLQEAIETIALSRSATARRQGTAAVETTVGFVSETVYQAVASAIHTFYKWISVIDNATTDICRSRNLRIFRYGVGPIPPAHYNCRSTTVPLAPEVDDFKVPTLYTWLREQPREYLDDLVGSKAADAIENGGITAANFNIATIVKPAAINGLSNKAKSILTRRSDGLA
ncbi:Phage head morphogenesis protein [Xanthomonas phage Suba]|uniref:Phage head morphogenesis protein n=1 Tax=Xanthomonas phage Suba TaxID=2674975 RepID=A0A679K1K8_9CAUD|nr:Phage head morphogenesis protein [Xanthomonas phage Suba]CAA2409735.1 Phage head morphogenesis protein [Xanthomonas phage Suba]